MSTRALIHIYNKSEDETPLTTIYKHYDGYPTKYGVGQTLKEYVRTSVLTNGLPLDASDNGFTHTHNGMGCFAAGIINHLKDGPGDVYIESPGEEDRHQSYTYEIRPGKSLDDRMSLLMKEHSIGETRALL